MSDELVNRMLLGRIAQEQYEENPPKIEEWRRTLKGCSELFTLAEKHLGSDPPNYQQAARAIEAAVRAGLELHPEVVLAFAMSGQASELFLQNLRDQMDD